MYLFNWRCSDGLKSCAYFRLGAGLAGTTGTLRPLPVRPLARPPIQPAATAPHSHGCRLLILPRVSRNKDDSSAAARERSSSDRRPVLSASESLAVRTESARWRVQPRIESSTAREDCQVEQCVDSPLRLLTGCAVLRRPLAPLCLTVAGCFGRRRWRSPCWVWEMQESRASCTSLT